MYNLSKSPARLKRVGAKVAMAALVCVAALAAAFAFSAPAQAQDNSYVDLAIEIDDSYVDLAIEISVGTSFTFTASNKGTATAYGVTLDIEIADQTIAGSTSGSIQKSGTTCSGNIPGTTCIGGVWTVGTLEPGEEREFAIEPRLASGLPCCPGISDNWTVPAQAVIKNTVPEEEERFKGNNTDVGWISVSSDGTQTEAAVGRYWLEASVDDLLAAAGDTVKFTFYPRSHSAARHFTADAKVRLKLDNGMGTPTATPPSGTTFAAATGLTRTWDWDIGNISVAPLEVSATLDNPLPAGVAVSDLCLTAELTARPDNLGVVGEVTYTSAEICLREDPVVLLQEGDATLWTMYPCVDVTAYPCSDNDTLEMRVVGGSAARAAGIARDEAILDPDRVFVQVKDPEGRRIDTYNASVNSGTAPSWHTARVAHTNVGNPVGGVQVSYTHREFTTEQRSNYNKLVRTVAVAGLDGATAPGAVKVRFPTSGNAEFTPNPSHERTDSPFPSIRRNTDERFVEFSTLGTYKIDYTASATHVKGTPSDTTDDVDYSGTGSYIFHVGPVAELEVSDGAAGLAPAGTRAFIIVAANNGPDDAPTAQVTVTGLNANDYVSDSATSGTFDFDSGTGIWAIGEIREPGYLRNDHGRYREVLTIITSATVGTQITAEIDNTQDYQVCIDSSGYDVELSSPSESACTTEDATNTWHTAKYYDHISDKNSATIEAKDGTGADLPTMRGAQEDTASIIVTWDPVSEVNGRAVTYYEVQRETNPWELLATVPYDADAETVKYVDTEVEAGETHQYRVRAVNDRGQGGLWSAPMEGMTGQQSGPRAAPRPAPAPPPPPDTEPGAPAIGSVEPGEQSLVVAWDAPEDDGGAKITAYDLRHIRSDAPDQADEHWTVVVDAWTTGDLAYTISELEDGREYDVQLRAVNEVGASPWSDTVAGTTLPDECLTRLGTLTGGVTRAGALHADCPSTSRSSSYAHFYSFTVPQQTEVTIELTSQPDTYLFLLEDEGRAGMRLEENDDATAQVSDSRITATLEAGTYTAEATTYSVQETGKFTLSIAGPGCSGTAPPSNACGIPLGTLTDSLTQEGTWAEDLASANREGSYAHFYSFTVPQQTEVTIELTSDTDPYLFLLLGAGKDGAVLQENDDLQPGEDTNSRIVVTLPAGTYTVEATTYLPERTGEFDLSVTVQALSIPALSDDVCVTSLGVLAGTVSQAESWTADCASTQREGSQAGFYGFTLMQQAEVTIDLASGTDTFLYLLQGAGRDGAVLHENDDVAEDDTDSRIVATLAIGTYTVEATTYTAGDTGEFTLGITGEGVMAGAQVTACLADLGTLSGAQTRQGTWADDCASGNREGSHARYYSFTLEQQTEVTIDLTSETDAFLYLLQGSGEDGAVETENDDAATGNTDSSITITLEAGTYTIEATTYEAGEVGEFSLAVTPAAGGQS